ncbi:MAG: YggT family protein [Burkholderiales bacterium]|nr:YggT family protein [Burkholderiales bacterium]
MLNQAASFLLETVFGLFALALLLRFYLQLVRAPYRNPVSQFLCALTDFMVVPARRIIPGLWGMDLATLVLAWLCEVVLLFALLALRGAEVQAATGTAVFAILVLAAVKILKMSIYILMVAVIVQAILSWVNPYSPVAPLLNSLTQPLLRPLQRRVPTVANVDLSPLVLIIALQLILMVPVAWLEMNVAKLF